jgi:hypothetical protein
MNMEAQRTGTINAARRNRCRFRGNGGVGDNALLHVNSAQPNVL